MRGKAGTPVEFGAKLSASLRDGYVFLDRIDWDNFNESGDLKAQVEAFKEATGVYPESVHVDRIYRIPNSDCHYFFSHKSFHPATAGFLPFFVFPTLITSFSGSIINSDYDWMDYQKQKLII